MFETISRVGGAIVQTESGFSQSPVAATNLQTEAWAAVFRGEDTAPGPFPEKPELLFDGERLIAFDPASGRVLKEWGAVSGLLDNGKTDPDRVNEKNSGPIPEGGYTVDRGDSNQHHWWKINWGEKEAWGNIRTEIKPDSDTETFGRDQMYVHGGDNPGSIGCVDLVGQNNDFHDWLENFEGPVKLHVDYDAANFDTQPDINKSGEWVVTLRQEGTELEERVVSATEITDINAV